MRYVPRILEQTIRRAIRTFPAIMVSGPRQSGKTTLLRHGWGKTHRYVSLDETHVRRQAIEDPVGFLRHQEAPIIIDEIQYAPNLLDYIKARIDQDRRPGRWLLTGSQPLSLMKGVGQSLAGRVATLTLWPLSYPEAHGARNSGAPLRELLQGIFGNGVEPGKSRARSSSLSRWIWRGGYPEPCLGSRVDPGLWCGSYVRTYLERDVRSVLNVGDLNDFERFLRLCAARTAQVLSLSDLARDTGISVPTAKKWISVLEACQQVFLLPPYYKNMGKRLIKAPKLYFADTAIAAYLMGLKGPEDVGREPYLGPLMETAIVAAWWKAFLHRGESPSLYYWRTQDGMEIDLIIDSGGRLYPLEIKTTATVSPRHAVHLAHWIRKIHAGQGRTAIMADVDGPQTVEPGVRAVPWRWV